MLYIPDSHEFSPEVSILLSMSGGSIVADLGSLGLPLINKKGVDDLIWKMLSLTPRCVCV